MQARPAKDVAARHRRACGALHIGRTDRTFHHGCEKVSSEHDNALGHYCTGTTQERLSARVADGTPTDHGSREATNVSQSCVVLPVGHKARCGHTKDGRPLSDMN